MKRISVDIGGTFTDCFLTFDEHRIEAKAPTTHYNLSAGFMNALVEAASRIGKNTKDILAEVDSVRYATTLGTNALLERSGPRLGLITTAGFEDTIIIGRCVQYADGLSPAKQADVPGADRPIPIISRDCIVGINERVDYSGQVLFRADPDDVQLKIQRLVDRGVRGFVVCLVNSINNPIHEDMVEQIILEEYPTCYLGSFPVVCSHDISLKKGEYTRSMSSILDAYLHREMQYGLGGLEMTLKRSGYKKPMQIVHNSGGMSQLNRTHALQTIHAGPVAGLSGSQQVGEELKIENLITTDMGGTSFDIGLITGGGIKFYEFTPIIDRWRVDIPMMFMAAIGAGGGSIARYDTTLNSITVGPESAGSEPGPACFDMGGQKPTVTDADLILGYLNPSYYNEGKMKLNIRRAKSALGRVAKPMGITIEDAAIAIRKIVDNNMAQAIFKEVALKGYDPRKFTLLVYGGNGPTHVCGYAEGLNISRAIAPMNSSIFSAVGAGNLDQIHIYDRNTYIYLYNANTGNLYENYGELNSIIEELKAKGSNDIVRMGYKLTQIRHRVEFDLRYGDQLALTTMVSPYLTFESPRQILDVIKLFHKSFGERFGEGSQTPEVGINLNNIRVVSFVPLDKVSFASNGKPERPIEGPSMRQHAPKGFRPCHFESLGGFVETPCYDYHELQAGAKLNGHAIVEAPHTTFVIYPDWSLELKENGFVWMEKLASR